MSAPGSLIAANEVNEKLRGGIVSVLFCAIAVPPDFVFCLFPRAAVPDNWVNRIRRGLRVTETRREGRAYDSTFLRIQLGLSRGVVQPCGGSRVVEHSRDLSHPVKTHRASDPIFGDSDVLSVTKCTVYEPVVRGNSLPLSWATVSSKLSRYPVSGLLVILSGCRTLLGGQPMYT